MEGAAIDDVPVSIVTWAVATPVSLLLICSPAMSRGCCLCPVATATEELGLSSGLCLEHPEAWREGSLLSVVRGTAGGEEHHGTVPPLGQTFPAALCGQAPQSWPHPHRHLGTNKREASRWQE